MIRHVSYSDAAYGTSRLSPELASGEGNLSINVIFSVSFVNLDDQSTDSMKAHSTKADSMKKATSANRDPVDVDLFSKINNT